MTWTIKKSEKELQRKTWIDKVIDKRISQKQWLTAWKSVNTNFEDCSALIERKAKKNWYQTLEVSQAIGG